MLRLLKREYGISRQEALTEYSWWEVQDLIGDIPVERIVNLNYKLTDTEYRQRYLAAICDEVEDPVNTDRIDESVARIRAMKAKANVV